MKFLSKLFNFVKNKNYNILSEEKLTFTFKRKENILLVSCAIIFNYISIQKKIRCSTLSLSLLVFISN